MATTKNVVGPVNPDLERERAQCSFKPEELAVWWYGGEEKLRKKRETGKQKYLLFLILQFIMHI